MKYLTFHGHITVPDDFEYDDGSKISKWVEKYLVDAEGLCTFNKKTGCEPEHWIGMTVLTEEQYEASFED